MAEPEKQIETLREMVNTARAIVFFGGAGVSTESGVPDFRGVDGLYHQHYKYPPEEILSHDFFLERTAEFYEFYRAKLLAPNNGPNPAHKVLARWEAEGKLLAVVTQNIDGLHQAAGSKNVIELHGSVHRNFCMDCGAFYDAAFIANSAGSDHNGVPRCEKCGGIIKPDVVLYGEPLDQDIMRRAVDGLSRADMLLIGGTSLSVYPAAGLVRYFRGTRIAVINRDMPDSLIGGGLFVQGSIGEVLGEV